MQVVDADAAHFKPGQMLWFNLTQNKVGGIVGTRKLAINPNSRLILEAPANRLEEYHVNIQFVAPGNPLFLRLAVLRLGAQRSFLSPVCPPNFVL